jgi:hypothetical protein
MNTDAINKVSEIIEGLCEKLGTTAQYLIPEMARMNIASGIYNIIVWVVITALGIVAAVYLYKKYKAEEEDWIMALSLIPATLALIGFIVIALCGEDLIQWFSSPTAKAVMTILKSLKD